MSKVLKSIEVPEAILPAFVARPTMVRANVWRDLTALGEHVENAKREAQSIMDQAEADAARVRELAREEGRAEGCAQFLKAVSQTRIDHAAWLERAEPEAVELALKIAERIVGDIIKTDPTAMKAIAVKAAIAARGRGDFEISIHPDAMASAQEVVQTVAAELGVNIRLRPDAGLNPADCVVHTSAGDIDARLATQLQAIRTVLLRPS